MAIGLFDIHVRQSGNEVKWVFWSGNSLIDIRICGEWDRIERDCALTRNSNSKNVIDIYTACTEFAFDVFEWTWRRAHFSDGQPFAFCQEGTNCIWIWQWPRDILWILIIFCATIRLMIIQKLFDIFSHRLTDGGCIYEYFAFGQTSLCYIIADNIFFPHFHIWLEKFFENCVAIALRWASQRRRHVHHDLGQRHKPFNK